MLRTSASTGSLADTAADTLIRRRLLTARALRSVAQGALVVTFPLYLDALGWSGAQIGALFSVIALVQATLTLFSGPLSDRFGRRRFLLGYEATLITAALLALSSATSWVLIIAALMGGFGRGMNGAAGPFAPVEQAWLARVTPTARRSNIFSLNTALGSFGMAVGALLAAALPLWQHALPGATAYRPLFALVLIAALLTGYLLWPVADSAALQLDTADPPPARHEENRRLLHIAVVNAINGAAIGLIGPLMTYWFFLRFDVGPARIGPVLALAFIATGLSALTTGRISRGGRVVSSVVRLRVLGLGLLLLLPLAPSFFWASVIYISRAALNRGTAGARQALNMSLISDGRRGFAATLASLSMQLPRSVGPVIAGAAFASGYLALPFYVAAALQAGYLLTFRHIFGRYEKQLPESLRRDRDQNN